MTKSGEIGESLPVNGIPWSLTGFSGARAQSPVNLVKNF